MCQGEVATFLVGTMALELEILKVYLLEDCGHFKQKSLGPAYESFDFFGSPFRSFRYSGQALVSSHIAPRVQIFGSKERWEELPQSHQETPGRGSIDREAHASFYGDCSSKWLLNGMKVVWLKGVESMILAWLVWSFHGFGSDKGGKVKLRTHGLPTGQAWQIALRGQELTWRLMLDGREAVECAVLSMAKGERCLALKVIKGWSWPMLTLMCKWCHDGFLVFLWVLWASILGPKAAAKNKKTPRLLKVRCEVSMDSSTDHVELLDFQRTGAAKNSRKSDGIDKYPQHSLTPSRVKTRYIILVYRFCVLLRAWESAHRFCWPALFPGRALALCRYSNAQKACQTSVVLGQRFLT